MEDSNWLPLVVHSASMEICNDVHPPPSATLYIREALGFVGLLTVLVWSSSAFATYCTGMGAWDDTMCDTSAETGVNVCQLSGSTIVCDLTRLSTTAGAEAYAILKDGYYEVDGQTSSTHGFCCRITASGVSRLELLGTDYADELYLNDGSEDSAVYLDAYSSNFVGYASGRGGDDQVDGSNSTGGTYTYLDVLHGDDANDVVRGNAGGDQIYGENGDDYLHGNSGTDTIDGGSGADYITGGSEGDTITCGSGADQAWGEGDNDTIGGGSENDSLYGGDGTDTITGDGQDDYIEGNAGADTINGGSGSDDIYGNADTDTIHGDGEDDYIEGNDALDYLYGDDGDDDMYGLAGADVMQGGAGADYMDGGTEGDTMNGNDGADQMVGAAGDDTIHGDGGDDAISGNDGADSLHGDNDVDTICGDDESGSTSTLRDHLFGGGGDDMLWGPGPTCYGAGLNNDGDANGGNDICDNCSVPSYYPVCEAYTGERPGSEESSWGTSCP